MKIGIDARFYGPRQKGLGRYVEKLVDNLEKVDSDNQYFIFLRQENWHEYRPSNPNFKKVLADYPWYGLKEQVLMPLKIKQTKVGLMHFPHFNVPLFYFGPFVVTIHDLILKRFPTRRASKLGRLLYQLKRLAYQITIYSAVKRAKKIIAVSDYTKKDILKYFKVEPTKIEVVYEGAPDIKDAKSTKHKTQSANSRLQKLGIVKPYLLYVGNAYPHKNLERLILAFNKLNQESRIKNQEYQLVLVGEIDYFYNRLKEFIHNSKFIIRDSIICTDFVSDEALALLYQKAALYIFPSLYEGFGLPPLEAMSRGLPVVASKRACLPEILGKAALYFDPENIEEMAEKIKLALEDSRLRQRLIVQGIKRSQRYCWLKMAQETLKLYQ